MNKKQTPLDPLRKAKKTGGATLPIFDLHPLDQSLGTIAGKLLEAHH
jgi:hypothetical protein